MKRIVSTLVALSSACLLSVSAFAAPYDPSWVPTEPTNLVTIYAGLPESGFDPTFKAFTDTFYDGPYFVLFSQGVYNKQNEENGIDYDRKYSLTFVKPIKQSSDPVQYGPLGGFVHSGGPAHTDRYTSPMQYWVGTAGCDVVQYYYNFEAKKWDTQQKIRRVSGGPQHLDFIYVVDSSELSEKVDFYPYYDKLGGLRFEVSSNYGNKKEPHDRCYDWWLDIKGGDIPPYNPYDPDDHLNEDVNGDGKPDINIDTNGNGKPDTNIDADGDGWPDVNIDTDGDGRPDTNIDTDGDGKPDTNLRPYPDVDKDTDGDGKPNINIDTDGDGKPDLNLDINGDGKPDVNIDTNGDGKPDVNIDTDGDNKPDINIDTNGDGKPDLNIDTNGDGKPNINIDTNGDRKPDLNIDKNGDKKPDVNIDKDGDGKPDLNIDTNGDGKPNVNIDTNGDGKPDLNIDTSGDGKPDTNIDSDGDGKPDHNIRPGGNPGGNMGNPNDWFTPDTGDYTYNDWHFYNPFDYDYTPFEWDENYDPLEGYEPPLMPDFPGMPGVNDYLFHDPFKKPTDISIGDYNIYFGG